MPRKNADKDEDKQSSLLDKLVITVLSGIILAILNNLFWQSQQETKRNELYLQQKIETYSELGRALTKLVATHNRMVETRHDKRLSQSDRNQSLYKIEGEMVETMGNLGWLAARTNAYFSQDTEAHLKKLVIELSKRSTGDKSIEPDSPLIQEMRALLRQISAEVKNEFEKWPHQSEQPAKWISCSVGA